MQTSSIVLLCAGLFIVNNTPAADQTVTVDCSKVLFTNDTVYHGVNYCAFWDDAQGSPGSRAALRRAGVQIIRFPGGEPANYLDWNQKTTYTTTSTDSLIAYARGVGARLMLGTNPTVNKVNDAGALNDSSAKHAADWLAHCMAGGDTVPFWEVGNEPESGNNWAQNDWDSTKLKWYYERFNAHSAAIKALNPKVKVMGPVAANTWYWWGVHDLAMFLKFCDKNCDAVSLHWYPVEQQYPGWDNIKAAGIHHGMVRPRLQRRLAANGHRPRARERRHHRRLRQKRRGGPYLVRHDTQRQWRPVGNHVRRRRGQGARHAGAELFHPPAVDEDGQPGA